MDALNWNNRPYPPEPPKPPIDVSAEATQARKDRRDRQDRIIGYVLFIIVGALVATWVRLESLVVVAVFLLIRVVYLLERQEGRHRASGSADHESRA